MDKGQKVYFKPILVFSTRLTQNAQTKPIWNLTPKLHQNYTVFTIYIYMFLSSNDFSMIMVWWFEYGMIVWLWCDGSEVVFVNVVIAYKSKKLQRNVKQKID